MLICIMSLHLWAIVCMGKFIGLKETPYSNFDEHLSRRKVSTMTSPIFKIPTSYLTLPSVPSFMFADIKGHW